MKKDKTTTKKWQTVEWKKNLEVWLAKDKNKRCQWCGSVKDILPHHQKEHEKDEVYLSLKTAIPLCSKCHFIFHKFHKRLCSCGQRYYDVKYSECYECNKKTKNFEEHWEENLKKFEEEENDEQQEAFNNWICHNCQFLEYDGNIEETELPPSGKAYYTKCKHPEVKKTIAHTMHETAPDVFGEEQKCVYKKKR